jgi:Fur family zinc uptake transcriptional regulator
MKTQRGHGETAPRRPRGRPLAQALRDAESICFEANEPLKPPRRRVLEILLSADAPMKAYDIIGAYFGSGRPVSPTTVYRSLEFLDRMGFIHRLESVSAYIACHTERRGHAAAFLICESCGGAEEFEPDLASEHAAAAAAGFKLERVTLEARGVCRNCL